jgi:hypothetical protein
MHKENKMSEENTVADEAQTPDINLNDIRNMLSVIDACSVRGAFKPEEMESVGALRNKVAAFLDANIPQEEEPADADVDPDPEGRTPPEEPTEEPAAE